MPHYATAYGLFSRPTEIPLPRKDSSARSVAKPYTSNSPVAYPASNEGFPRFPYPQGQQMNAPPSSNPEFRRENAFASYFDRTDSFALQDLRTPTPPSLVSTSSMSAQESPRPRVLRKKPSVIGRVASQKTSPGFPPDASRPQESYGAQTKISANSHMGLEPPFMSRSLYRSTQEESHGSSATAGHHARAVPMPGHFRPLHEADNRTRFTPVSEVSTTPSIPPSDSPGAFSHVTTHTSLTSPSPAMSSSSRAGANTSATPPSPNRRRLVKQERPVRKNSKPSPTSSPHPAMRAPPNITTPPLQTAANFLVLGKPPTPHKDVHAPTNLEGTVPELAHLMNQSPRFPRSQISEAPSRPSRDGIDSPGEQPEVTPIIHSNLASLERGHSNLPKRSSVRSPSSGPSESSRREVNRRSRSATEDSKLARPPTLPRLQTSQQQNGSDSEGPRSAGLPTPISSGETSASKSKSRFGFFSRRSKTSHAETKETKQDAPRQGRKGPAAGTGHEGYGRFAAPRGANTSSTSVHSAPARSTSAGSTQRSPLLAPSKRKSSGGSNKASELDQFLQQRLSPVYIRGDGSTVGSQGPQSDSAVEDDPPSVFSSPQTAHTSHSSYDCNPSSGGNSRNLGDLDVVNIVESKDRRVASPEQINTNIKTNSESTRPHQTKNNTLSPHVESRRSTDVIEPRPSLQVPPGRPSTSSMSSRPRKSSDASKSPNKEKKSNWSFFSKNANSSKSAHKWGLFPQPKQSSENETPVPEKAALPLAHYTVHDSGEPVDMDDLERMMKEADAALADDASSVYTTFEDDDHVERTNSIDQKSADVGKASTINDFSIDESNPMPRSGHSSNSQAKEDGHRKLPDQSFSRPFLTAQPRPTLSPPTPTSQPFKLQSDFGPSSASTKSPTDQFFNFEPRKNSDLSYSSSSNATYFPTATSMASQPNPAPASSPDEEWKEYDELIDNVLTPGGTSVVRKQAGSRGEQSDTVSTTEKFAAPHELRKSGSEGKTMFPQLNGPQFVMSPESTSAAAAKRNRLSPPPKPCEDDQSASPITSFIAGYADRNNGPSPQSQSKKSQSDRGSNGSNKSARSNSLRLQEGKPSFSLGHKRSTSLPGGNVTPANGEQEESTMVSQNKSKDPSQAIFRFRVLMTSKWLSFGRVLFSPAQSELGANIDDRVLVVDGLGKGLYYISCMAFAH